MKYVKIPVRGSSLIDPTSAKNYKLVVDFAMKKLGLSIKKNEKMLEIENEILDQLRVINPEIVLVQRDLTYDLLNLAIQNLLDQAQEALGNSRSDGKKKKPAVRREEAEDD